MKWKDYGESSLTLLAVHCGIDKKNPAIPRDPSDFKRCIHLFKCLDFGFNEIHYLLLKTTSKYNIWRPLFDHWSELTELYELEKNKKSAPKLYALLKEVTNNVKY